MKNKCYHDGNVKDMYMWEEEVLTNEPPNEMVTRYYKCHHCGQIYSHEERKDD